MITCYARSLDRNRRHNVLVEDGIVVKEYVTGDLFRSEGNPELIGQPEASLQALGFEQVPGPLERRWGLWVSITLEEMKKDEEKWSDFFEQSARDALMVSGTSVEIAVPKFYPTLGKEDWFTIEKWHVSEGDIVQASEPLVTIDCAVGLFDIPAPSQDAMVLLGVPTPPQEPYRVERILAPAGSSTHLGKLILVLKHNE